MKSNCFVAGSFWVDKGTSNGYLGLPIYKLVDKGTIMDFLSRKTSMNNQGPVKGDHIAPGKMIELVKIAFLQLRMVNESSIFRYNRLDFNDVKINKEANFFGFLDYNKLNSLSAQNFYQKSIV
jgi:hypothetical protein